MENILYKKGKECLGKDMSPTENELGCVQALFSVFRLATGQDLGETLSTIRLYDLLLKDTRFERITVPEIGAIIISPTNGQNIGHCGIISDEISDKNFLIMSNRSSDSKWSEHLTLAEWWYKYKALPLALFRYKENVKIELEEKKKTILLKIIELYKEI